jgi:hypothetical protein
MKAAGEPLTGQSLRFVGRIDIFPGIIAAISRIAAVDGPVRPLELAIRNGPHIMP